MRIEAYIKDIFMATLLFVHLTDSAMDSPVPCLLVERLWDVTDYIRISCFPGPLVKERWRTSGTWGR